MKTMLQTALLAFVFVSAVSAAAFARGGKEYFVQDYQFDQPMSGYEGKAGNYYCSYQRLPNRVCTTDSNGNEHCKIKGWTLRQHCY